MTSVRQQRATVSKARAAAKGYRERGWKVIPIPGNSKSPVETGWPTRDFDDQDFGLWSNVGVQFGEPSGGLCDVDLDCEEALSLADDYLPATGSEFGRELKRRAHRLYVSDLHETEDKAALQFKDPIRHKDDPKSAMLVELRIGGGGRGAQTMFPPSLHPANEYVEWDEDGEPKNIKGRDLNRGVADLAAACLLVRYYPREGRRDEAAMAIGGLLARAGWKAHHVEDFYGPVVRAVDDEEADQRVAAAVASIRHLEEDKETTGFPKVAELWGEEVASTVAEWLGIEHKPNRQKGNAEDRPLVIRYMDSFEFKPINWLWHPFIPSGLLTGFFGDGGVGKSTLLLDIIARLSRGGPMPWFGQDSEAPHITGTSIILTREDMFGSIVRPRLEAARANLSRICSIGHDNPSAHEGFDPVEAVADIADRLAEKIKEIGDVRIIVIDPITDFVGDANINSTPEVRRMLYPLSQLAARFDIAIVFVLHFNKKSDQPARYRGSGSEAFRNVPRSSCLVVPTPERPGSGFLIQEKRNLTSAQNSSVMFHLSPAPRSHYASVVWEDDWQNIPNIDDIINGKPPSQKHKAADFLKRVLADGPMLSTDLMEKASNEGFSESTLKRAKKEAGAWSRRVGDCWEWKLLDDDARTRSR